MTTDVTDRLAALGDALRSATAPITADEVRPHSRVAAISVGDDPVLLTVVPQRRRRWRTPTAAFAAAVVIIVGLAVLVRMRSNEDATTTAAPLTANGRASIVDTPDGWTLVAAADFTDQGSDPVFVSRVYAADTERPESAPAIEVQSYASVAASPSIPANATAVDIGTVIGNRYVDEEGRAALSFERDQRWFVLLTQQQNSELLLEAAEHTTADPGGDGAVIDQAGLPGDFAEIASGFRSGIWLQPATAAASASPDVWWRRGSSLDAPSIRATSVPGAGLTAVQRLWADRVEEITVHGLPALVVVEHGTVGVVWYEQNRTWFVTGYQTDIDDVVTFANALSGVDDQHWQAMKAAVAPPLATSIDGGPAQPGSLVPSGTSLFPRIDGNLVPDRGRGPTYAYYTYDPAGIETAGPSWRGTLRKDLPDGTFASINITVTTTDSAVPRSDTTPGRQLGVEEWNFGSGTDLYATIDGYEVTLEGSDIDLLYDVLDAIEPTTVDGRLHGYSFPRGLPPGMYEFAPPFGHDLDTGAFPTVVVHNGALTMRIDPTPIANVLGQWPAFTATRSTPFGAAHFDPSRNDGLIAIELANGQNLQLSSQELNTDEVLALTPSIELVDETTWQTEYHPRLAIVPDTAPATSGEVETAATEPSQELPNALDLPAGTILTAPARYVIEDGDFVTTIATEFEVSLADLLAANGWQISPDNSLSCWPGAGQPMIIPAGATVPDESSRSTKPSTTSPAATPCPTPT